MPERPPGASNIPPPSNRPGPGDDALSQWLGIAEGSRPPVPDRRRPGGQREDEVVSLLRQREGTAPIDELQRGTGLGFTDFTHLLLALESDGVVGVDGPPGHEVVSLREEAGPRWSPS